MIKSRQSNFELLRIISILLIIMFHYVYKCQYTFEVFNINAFLVKVIWLFGELGVNLFILIMGYFMCKNKFSFKKLILLILEVAFYNLLANIILYKLGLLNINGRRSLFLLFFPLTLNKYWFITAYILIYILSPYLNVLIKNMDKKIYLKFLFSVLIIWCFIPTVFGMILNTTEILLYYSRFIWLIIVYFIGAYIRLHEPKILRKKKNCILLGLISFSLMVLFILLVKKFSGSFALIGLKEPAYFWTPNSLLMIILSVSVFCIFAKIKINKSRIINTIASTTLGIYLIHDGQLNSYIWNNIFKTFNYINGNYFIIHIIVTSLIILLFGALIDLIRQFIEKYTVKKILDSKYSTIFRNKCNLFFEKILKHL